MSKTKGISKKKNLLKVFWNKCPAFKVIICILIYVILGFINIPINKLLTFHVREWSDCKLSHVVKSFLILPFVEILTVTLICLGCVLVVILIVALIYIVRAVVGKCFCHIGLIIACKNYCYIPFTEEEIKEKGFQNANEYFTYVLDMISYGFENEKENLQITYEDLRKMLIACLNVFPDNGTIFQIDLDVARKITCNVNFVNGLVFGIHGKARIENGCVVLSCDTQNGEREFTI